MATCGVWMTNRRLVAVAVAQGERFLEARLDETGVERSLGHVG